MRKRDSLSSSLRNFIVSLIIAIVVICAMALLVPRWIQKSNLEKKKRLMDVEKSVLERKNIKLKEEVDSLQNDPVYLEKIARDELGLKKQDEVIYKFED